MKVSIICPLYKGNKYIKNIINMIYENYISIRECNNILLELILVNDYPSEIIECPQIEEFEIKLIQNKINSGIHYSRVCGLMQSQGDYVLFLDQDDEIECNYIKSQMEVIGNADAVICNGLNQGFSIYYSESMIKKACKIDTYFNGNNIVSPGQVLLKRASIPNEWQNYLLKNNGADDYFLWLLMFINGKKFVYNYKKLYNHKTTDNNTSNDLQVMMNSVFEVIEYMSSKNLITDIQTNIMKTSHDIKMQSKSQLEKKYTKNSKIVNLLDIWLYHKQNNRTCEKYIKDNCINKVVVYGCGILGRHLVIELNNIGVEIEYIIDKDYNQGVDGISTIKIGDKISKNAVIIITPVLEFEEIREKLRKYYNNTILTINQIIDNMQ